MQAYRIVIFALLIVSCLIWWDISLTPQKASARPTILSAWRNDVYTNSLSDDVNCQLCHQRPTGGNGWNAYGWSIRQQIRDQGLTPENAFRAVEIADADGNGQTNLAEINGNAQPGWRAGAVNTIFFLDGTTLTEQSPPSSITLLDLPDETILGDVNCDGTINSVDGLFILQFDIGLRVSSDQCPPAPGMAYLPACDVNNDGVCGSVDGLFVLQCDIGQLNALCPDGTDRE